MLSYRIANDFYLYQINSTLQQGYWSLEKGYSSESVLVYPLRPLDAGPNNGLQIMFKLNDSDIDYLCIGPAKIYTVGLLYFLILYFK